MTCKNVMYVCLLLLLFINIIYIINYLTSVFSFRYLILFFNYVISFLVILLKTKVIPSLLINKICNIYTKEYKNKHTFKAANLEYYKYKFA